MCTNIHFYNKQGTLTINLFALVLLFLNLWQFFSHFYATLLIYGCKITHFS